MDELLFTLATEEELTKPFTCGVTSINEYVEEAYYPLISQHAYTYTISSKGHILGFYQILVHEIALDDFPQEISDFDPNIKQNNKIAALHIRFLAIDEKYQHKGIGTVSLRNIIRQTNELVKRIPISVITIDARSDLVSWYEKEGFKKMLKNTPGQGEITTAMFYNCLQFADKLSEYEDRYMDF